MPETGNMSKSKGLEFDRSQPAFLQRLRGQITGQTGDPDRQVDAQARPKRPKRLDAEEDDGPTYVLEDTNDTLTKEEYDALMNKDANGANASEKAEASKDSPEKAQNETKPTQKLGAIGAAKKRKAVKVIGGDEDEDQVDVKEGEKGDDKKVEGKKAPKKKKAKVKIDFGDDET